MASARKRVATTPVHELDSGYSDSSASENYESTQRMSAEETEVERLRRELVAVRAETRILLEEKRILKEERDAARKELRLIHQAATNDHALVVDEFATACDEVKHADLYVDATKHALETARRGEVGVARRRYEDAQGRLVVAKVGLQQVQWRLEDNTPQQAMVRYSRECDICYCANPAVRNVLTCGHMLCRTCTDKMKHTPKKIVCPWCRYQVTFVKLRESELPLQG